MKTIKVRVNDKTAEQFLKMSEADKEGIAKLLDEIIEDPRSLRNVMDDMGQYAKQQGLTPEILDKILNENKEE